MEELNQQVISSGEELQTCQSEIIELRHTVQALEIDLDAQHNMVCQEDNIWGVGCV